LLIRTGKQKPDRSLLRESSPQLYAHRNRLWLTNLVAYSPLPGATKTKPGSATLPFFGIEPILLDPTSGKVVEGNDVEGVLAIKRPWPSMARTVYGDHKR
jgi:acyl-coenzyme A synthetase/AMP-(fatty) acid ligase